MNRLLNFQADLNIQRKRIAELDKSYEGKLKGDAYIKARELIIKRMKAIQSKAVAIGCNYAVAQVKGKRRRPHRKSPSIMVTESYTIYFVGTTEEEVPTLIKLHIKNSIEHTVRFFRSGQILTTRN